MIPPSGEQFELARGAQRAVVVEVGGGLREYGDVLLGYGVDEMCSAGRGQVLAPWPNRLAGGTLRVRRRDVPARADRAEDAARRSTASCAGRAGARSSASESARRAWSTSCTRSRAIRSRCACRSSTRSATTGSRCDTTAENVGDRACPFGAGHHPYIAVHVDDGLRPESSSTRRAAGTARSKVGDVDGLGRRAWTYVQLFTGDLPDVRGAASRSSR